MNASEQINALTAISTKEIRRFLRMWLQTLVPPLVATVLHFIIFGEVIGKRIGVMAGVSYLDFFLPGFVMMTIINNAYLNVATSFFSAKFEKSIDVLLISPTPTYIIIFGFVSGGMVRGFVVGAFVMAISTFFTSVQIHNVVILFLVFS